MITAMGTPACTFKQLWDNVRFDALFVENDNIHQDIKGFSCQPCGQIFRKKCTLSFHIEIKHPDPNMPVPDWSCEICKEPYPHSRAIKGHIK